MATTASSVRPPLPEDNNLALEGRKARLTGKETTRTVLPNLTYPLQTVKYRHHQAAQPTSTSSVDPSPPSYSCDSQHVGGISGGSGVSAPSSNRVRTEASAGGSLGDWAGWSIQTALERMGSHVSTAAKTLRKWHGRFSRHPNSLFDSSP